MRATDLVIADLADDAASLEAEILDHVSNMDVYRLALRVLLEVQHRTRARLTAQDRTIAHLREQLARAMGVDLNPNADVDRQIAEQV